MNLSGSLRTYSGSANEACGTRFDSRGWRAPDREEWRLWRKGTLRQGHMRTFRRIYPLRKSARLVRPDEGQMAQMRGMDAAQVLETKKRALRYRGMMFARNATSSPWKGKFSAVPGKGV